MMTNTSHDDGARGAGDGDGDAAAGAFLASLKAGAGDAIPGLTTGARSSRLTSIGVILLVVAIAAGALFVMRQLGLGTSLDFAEITIDYEFKRETAAPKDHRRILSDLKTSREIKQVPLEEVQMDPFAWNVSTRAKEEVVDLEAARRERERIQAEERRRAIQTAFDLLRLRSVVGGSHPVAQISGKLVRVGDEVGEYFTVTVIEGRSVELTADGQTFVMSLQKP